MMSSPPGFSPGGPVQSEMNGLGTGPPDAKRQKTNSYGQNGVGQPSPMPSTSAPKLPSMAGGLRPPAAPGAGGTAGGLPQPQMPGMPNYNPMGRMTGMPQMPGMRQMYNPMMAGRMPHTPGYYPGYNPMSMMGAMGPGMKMEPGKMNTEGMNPDTRRQYVNAAAKRFAPWFDVDLIHKAEERALPEWFFKNKKTTKTRDRYMEYRNWIIDRYFMNPTEYLTATTCRKHLCADACAIVRLHSFLDYLQIINRGLKHPRVQRNSPKQESV